MERMHQLCRTFLFESLVLPFQRFWSPAELLLPSRRPELALLLQVLALLQLCVHELKTDVSVMNG